MICQMEWQAKGCICQSSRCPPCIVHVTGGLCAEVAQLGAHSNSKSGGLQAAKAAVMAERHHHARSADCIIYVPQICDSPCVHLCLQQQFSVLCRACTTSFQGRHKGPLHIANSLKDSLVQRRALTPSMMKASNVVSPSSSGEPP